MASEAAQAWQAAQKLCRGVLKEVELLKSDSSDGNETTHFEKLDTLMSNYRLACVQTLFLDVQYASQKDVEVVLWRIHVFVNDRYRKILARLKAPQQAVVKRKVEKLYGNFLKVSQYFYRGYVQRLCARYKVPRLEHIAKSMELEPMALRPEEHVDAIAEGIDGLVLRSCQRTLVYMGDLSRYRGQTRQKSQGSDTALLYYSLANDLLPSSGYGHHQMGVIYLDEKKHFEIVYHFFRAWAAEDGHPNAANNLEVEFGDLLRSASPKSHGPHDAMKSWFVRLHAFFNRGRVFPQHAEMEQEVVHRFEMALESCDAGPTLLHMLLVNVCAYRYAQEKVRAKWSETTSQACQFVLQLNIRTMLALARVLGSELQDLDKHAVSGSTKSPEESVQTNPVISGILPLMRVFLCWLGIHRDDIVSYAPHLQPHVEEMYEALSQALTALLDTYGGAALASVPYLLPEDLELQGIKGFDDAGLPPALKLLRSDQDGQKKPRVNDSDRAAAVNSQAEFLGRAMDVLKCGFCLAGDKKFPLIIDTLQRDSQPVTVIRYVAVDEPQYQQQSVGSVAMLTQANLSQPVDESGMETSVSRLSLSHSDIDSGMAPAAAAAAAAAQFQTIPTGYGDAKDECRPATSGSGYHGSVGVADLVSDTDGDQDGDFDEDRLFNIVNDFLAPPEAKSPQQQQQQHQETSDGMHTVAGDSAAGPALTSPSPAPNSSTGKRFPSLPWDYFYTPTPQQRPGAHVMQVVPATQGGQGASLDETPRQRTSSGSLTALPNSTSTGSSTGIGIQGVDRLEDPFHLDHDVQRFSGLVASVPESSAAAWAEAEQYRLLGKGLLYKEEAAREIYGGAFQGQGQSHGHEWPAPAHGWNAAVGGRIAPAASTAYYTGGPMAAYPTDPMAAASSSPAMQAYDSSFDYRTTFSGASSALPPVNSPWGLSHAPHQQQMLPTSAAQPGTALTLASPESTSMGSVDGGGYGQGLTYNGVTYNATTAYGRGTIATKDDPTHFKNVVKSSGLADVVAEADEYDRRVLASALLDDHPKPR